MKKPLFALPQGLAMRVLITLCVGVGCAYPLLLALEMPNAFPLCMAVCAGAALLMAALECIPRLRGLFYPLLLLAMAACLAPYYRQLDAVSAALALFANGQSVALAAYARLITAFLSLALTAMGASLARSEHAFFPLALVMIGLLLALSFLGVDVSALALLPLLLALMLCARAAGVTIGRILPCAAAVLLLTMLLTPLSHSTVPALETFAQDLRRTIDDYLFFTEPRTAFSFSSTGWQPLGAERLGGPVSPTDTPVMQVETSERTLLRATIKNEYTGLAWADTTSGRRYLFVSPRFMQLRRDLFDQNRPAASVLESLPDSEAIRVTLLADAASTLYLTQRFVSPAGDGVVAYYSPASEVFATRSLVSGDSYTFYGRRLTASSADVRDAVLASYDERDANYETVKNTYLQLPASVESRVYELARQIAASGENSFDRAAALCTYLQNAFTYTLNQSEPPLDRDFVSWFLFEEQRGYCTSFASSLTVMARAVGLPARYVEGYAAAPDNDGIARVTQQNAHAWTEIYFPGFGWLTFDPTPGSGSAPDGSPNWPDAPSNDPDNPEDPDSPPDGDDNPDDQSGASESPTPSPEPTPEPTPTPSPTPEHNDPAVTPTPEITPAPTPGPTPEPTPAPPEPPKAPDNPDDRLPPWLLPLLVLLLLAALIAARMAYTSPARVAGRYRNPGDSLLIWYRASEEALLCLGVTPQPGEAPASFLLRAQEALGGKPTLLPLGRALCVARYSGRRLKPAGTRQAEKTYRALLARLNARQKARLYARRFVRGTKLM